MSIPVNRPEPPANVELHDGSYDAVIEKCEERVPRSGNGSHLFVMPRIAGPACIGAVVFDHITLTSSSDAAVYYGTKKLHQLLEAVGLGGVTSFEPYDLIGKRVRIVIRMKHTDRWGWQPEVVAYEKAENGSAPADEADADGDFEEDTQDAKDYVPF